MECANGTGDHQTVKTVADLIRELGTLPQDAKVVVYHPDDGYMPATWGILPGGAVELQGDWDALLEDSLLDYERRMGISKS